MCFRSAALPFGVLLLVLASPPLGAQALGEVARQEEARRKSIKTESKVYTNKDLARVPPATAPPSAPPVSPSPADAPSPESGASAATSESPSDTPKRDQAYWGRRMKELQDTLDRNLTYLDALQSRINALATDFVNRDDPAQRAKIETDRGRAIAEQERLQAQVLADRKAIADLQEEARRSSVPPGWLR